MTASGRAVTGTVAVAAVAIVGYGAAALAAAQVVDVPPLSTSAAFVLILAAVVQVASAGFFGQLFRRGVEATGSELSAMRAFRAALVGCGVARLLPAGGAVTPVAMAWSVRRTAPGAGGAALRATALNYAGLLLGTGAAMGHLAITEPDGWPPVAVFVAIAAVVAGSALMVAASSLASIARRLPGRLRRQIGTDLVDLPNDGVTQLLVWGRLASEAWVLHLVMLAFGLEVGLVAVAAAFGLTQLISGIPGPPGGLGISEAGMVGSLVLLGFTAVTVVVPVLVYRLVSYWLPAALGIAAGGATLLSRRFRIAAPSLDRTLSGTGDGS